MGHPKFGSYLVGVLKKRKSASSGDPFGDQGPTVRMRLGDGHRQAEACVPFGVDMALLGKAQGLHPVVLQAPGVVVHVGDRASWWVSPNFAVAGDSCHRACCCGFWGHPKVVIRLVSAPKLSAVLP